MSENVIEELYSATKQELDKLGSKNKDLSKKVDELKNSSTLLNNIYSARLEELQAAILEAKSIDGIVSQQELDQLVREFESEKSKIETSFKADSDKIQKEIQDRVDELNSIRAKIREATGKISVHERVLKLRKKEPQAK